MGTTAATPCTLYPPSRIARDAALAVATMLGLWLSAQHSYLLFHSIAEIFSIIVAGAIYMVSWSSRDYPEAKPFLLLGIGYLFVAFLDVGHVLSYRGMGVLPNSTDDATRLWVAARGLQALFTLAFVLLARKGHRTPPLVVFLVGGALTLFAFLSIFLWNIFPLCLVEGVGLTPFKKISEYVICAVFLLSGILIWRDTDAVTLRERRLLSISFGLMIAAELLFTMYVSAYGLANLVGHFLKIAAFYFAYQALFASKIESRLALIEQLTRTTTQLESSRADLEKANLSKDKFFSIIAHDLRNPIGGLVTISELLSTRFDDLGAARVRDLVRLLNEGAVHSAELLECILQWARAQTGRLEVHPSPLRLAELCDGIVELEGAAAAAKEIRLESRVSPEAIAFADHEMVATIVRNLVSNALKFTPRGGEVVVGSRRDHDALLLTVTDNGVGMSAVDAAKLFRIDVSFSSPGTESEKGHGMGLILCRELVQLNRGTIEVTSAPAHGSTFTVRLPAATLDD